MTTEILVPALAFGSLFAMLLIGVYGVKGAKKAKREGYESALAHDDDAGDAR